MSDFVICINNDSNPASLILGKVYRTLSDAEAEAHNMLRVIDEDKSELDGYLYPASMRAGSRMASECHHRCGSLRSPHPTGLGLLRADCSRQRLTTVQCLLGYVFLC